MSFPLFVDICSRFQPSNPGYFKKLSHKGVTGAFTQLTYGNYPDPTIPTKNQINNSLHYLKWCGCYQFFLGHPVVEASYMIALLNHTYHMDKSTPVMLDVEGSVDYYARFPQTKMINQWIDKMYDAGFHNIFIYTMASFVWSGYVLPKALHHNAKIWIANYGGNEPGVNGANAWQYTDNFCGMSTDGDYLFMPLSTMTGQSNKSKKSTKKPVKKNVRKPVHKIIHEAKQHSKPAPKLKPKAKITTESGTFKVTGKIERLK